jgi:hypothetical protein
MASAQVRSTTSIAGLSRCSAGARPAFFGQENTFIGARRHRQQVCNTVLLYFAGERLYAKIAVQFG